jgi:hypothetical protein
MTGRVASSESPSKPAAVVVAFVLLTIAPFVRAATRSWFWSPQHSMAPVATALFLALLAALVIGRYRWAWIVVVFFEASTLVGWAVNPTPLHAIDTPFYIASIASFVLLLSPAMRHRLRKPVLVRVKGRLDGRAGG